MKNSYSEQEKEVLRSFGQRLRRMRRMRDLTQEKLAEEADMNRNYISDVEHGRRNIGLLNIHQLARAFKLPSKELFPDDI